jgi:putrescine transport system permease protein
MKRSAGRHWLRGRSAVIGIPYAWLLVFFLLPFLVVAKISISEMETTTISDIVTWKNGAIAFNLKFGN